jgi:hypothetical protein
MYDSVFPPSDSVSEQRQKTPTGHSVNGANVHHGHEVLS